MIFFSLYSLIFRLWTRSPWCVKIQIWSLLNVFWVRFSVRSKLYCKLLTEWFGIYLISIYVRRTLVKNQGRFVYFGKNGSIDSRTTVVSSIVHVSSYAKQKLHILNFCWFEIFFFIPICKYTKEKDKLCSISSNFPK